MSIKPIHNAEEMKRIEEQRMIQAERNRVIRAKEEELKNKVYPLLDRLFKKKKFTLSVTYTPEKDEFFIWISQCTICPIIISGLARKKEKICQEFINVTGLVPREQSVFRMDKAHLQFKLCKV